jgi:SAM-dependent methyltransferase
VQQDATPFVTMETLRNCPSCLGAPAEVLHHQEFALIAGHPLASGYDVVACHTCGFVYADTSATQEDYNEFYEQMSKYSDPATGTGSGALGWDAERLRDTATTVARFLDSSEARILDIGCAGGGLLCCLRALGFNNSIGVDPSASCVAEVRAKGLDGMQGAIGSLTFRARSFDCIVLSGVLEHLRDLHGALKGLVPLLKANGFLYIEVPDATAYAEFLYSPFQDFNTEHINHFSPSTLRGLLRGFGLGPVFEGRKSIRSSATSFYPDIYGVFRANSDGAGEDGADGLTSRIKLYIAASRQMLSEMSERLDLALTGSSGVIIWGVGQLTMKLLRYSPLARSKIVAFVDSSPVNRGRMLREVRIVDPEDLREMPHPIVIASLLHQSEIAQQIRSMGLDNRLIFLRDRPEIPFIHQETQYRSEG